MEQGWRWIGRGRLHLCLPLWEFLMRRGRRRRRWRVLQLPVAGHLQAGTQRSELRDSPPEALSRAMPSTFLPAPLDLSVFLRLAVLTLTHSYLSLSPLFISLPAAFLCPMAALICWWHGHPTVDTAGVMKKTLMPLSRDLNKISGIFILFWWTI